MRQEVKLPLVVLGMLAVLVVVWLVARQTVLKPPPEPPKLKPPVQVRPNMPADEAAKIFSIPTGPR